MQAIFGLLARHLLTGVGGALVSKGIITTSMVEPVLGAITLLGGVIWSYAQKKKSGALEPN